MNQVIAEPSETGTEAKRSINACSALSAAVQCLRRARCAAVQESRISSKLSGAEVDAQAQESRAAEAVALHLVACRLPITAECLKVQYSLFLRLILAVHCKHFIVVLEFCSILRFYR